MKNFGQKVLGLFLGALSLMALSIAPSYAAVDPAVTTALTGAGADSLVVGAAVTVILVGIFAIKIVRKAL